MFYWLKKPTVWFLSTIILRLLFLNYLKVIIFQYVKGLLLTGTSLAISFENIKNISRVL